MFAWLAENYITVTAAAAVAAIIAGAVVSLVRNKRKGRSSCGCGCANCPMSGACHKK